MKNRKIKQMIINSVDPDKCEITADDLIKQTNLKYQSAHFIKGSKILKLSIMHSMVGFILLIACISILMFKVFKTDNVQNQAKGEYDFVMANDAKNYFADHSSIADLHSYVRIVEKNIFNLYIFRGEDVIRGCYLYFYYIEKLNTCDIVITPHNTMENIVIENMFGYGAFQEVPFAEKDFSITVKTNEFMRSYSFTND